MYATEIESLVFFDARLHAEAWENANSSDRLKSLRQASSILDNLNYRGEKSPAFQMRKAIELSGGPIVESVIQAAGLTQEHEFPRQTDATIPPRVKDAACLIAYALLIEGVDPATTFSALDIESDTHGSVRTAYSKAERPPHVLAGVPSAEAWQLIYPFLRDTRTLQMFRG